MQNGKSIFIVLQIAKRTSFPQLSRNTTKKQCCPKNALPLKNFLARVTLTSHPVLFLEYRKRSETIRIRGMAAARQQYALVKAKDNNIN
jgi:hypothetical protein